MELLNELRPVLVFVSGFIDEGVQIAKAFFEQRSTRTDPWLFSHIVRWHICSSLDGAKEISVPFSRVGYPLSGVEISYGERKIKVFKANAGTLPPAGRSRSRQSYWNGNLFSSFDGDFFSTPNLVLLWDVDELFSLALTLVCPRADGQFWKSGQILWSIAIPYPWVVQTETTVNTEAVEITGLLGEAEVVEDFDFEENASDEGNQ